MPRVDAPPPTTTRQTEIRLTLELERDGGAALLRVVSTLHRRRCRVIHADFHGDSGGCDRLELRIQAPRAYAPRVEHWLRGLVDVRRATVLAAE